MTPPLHTCLRPGHMALWLKAGACVLMHTITLCYSHHPSVAPVIKSESTLGLSEVVVYGLPVSNGFMLPVRITRGYLYWAPCVSAPPSLHSPVSNPGRQRRVCACRGCSASSTTFRTTMAFTLRVLGGRLCSRVRPGGRCVPGYV